MRKIIVILAVVMMGCLGRDSVVTSRYTNLDGVYSIEILAKEGNLSWEWSVEDMDYCERNSIWFEINKVFRRDIGNGLEWSRVNVHQNKTMCYGEGEFEMDGSNAADPDDPRVFYEFIWDGFGKMDFDIAMT